MRLEFKALLIVFHLTANKNLLYEVYFIKKVKNSQLSFTTTKRISETKIVLRSIKILYSFSATWFKRNCNYMRIGIIANKQMVVGS